MLEPKPTTSDLAKIRVINAPKADAERGRGTSRPRPGTGIAARSNCSASRTDWPRDRFNRLTVVVANDTFDQLLIAIQLSTLKQPPNNICTRVRIKWIRLRMNMSTVRDVFSFLKAVFIPPVRFDPKLEREFLVEYSRRYAVHRRAAVVLAIVTWTSFYSWDSFHFRNTPEFAPFFYQIIAWRTVGLILLTTAGTVLFTRLVYEERIASITLSLAGVAAFTTLLSMILTAPFPFNYLFYYGGLSLVMAFTFGLLRLLSRTIVKLNVAFLVISAVLLQYAVNEGQMPLSGSVLKYYFSAAYTYLLSFALVGNVVSVELERSARDAFARERALSDAGHSLRQKNSELEAVNRSLTESERDTQIKTQALVALKEELRIQAERQSAAKSKFIADAAHDLRQPMQALANLIEAAGYALKSGEKDKCTQYLMLAEDAARLTRSSFNAVLDISRLESGFVQAEYSEFELHEVINEVVHSVQPLAERQSVRLVVRHSARDRVFVRSDRHLLSRAVANLVDNAVKYSDPTKPDGAKTLIAVVALPGKVKIEIIDNGIGIEQRDWPKVFKPFVQLSNPERDREKGVGLGLSIVSAITNLLDGHRVEMSSEEGRGTRFTVSLPRADDREFDSDGHRQASGIDAGSVEGLYILYIEDDRLVRRATNAVFETYGILSESFATLHELQSALSSMERLPDLIVTDYRLPDGRNARDVIAAVTGVFGEPVPTIVLTGEVLQIDESMATRILRKPVLPKDLIRHISEVCQHPAEVAV
jgi:two-component system, sensor histidine kinase